jgi:mycofactocin precursor
MMDDATTTTIDEPREPGAQDDVEDDELVLEELLVEDVSIDGMCGVY